MSEFSPAEAVQEAQRMQSKETGEFRRRSVSETVTTYVDTKMLEGKTEKDRNALKDQMIERAVKSAREGAKHVRKNIAEQFSIQNPDGTRTDALHDTIEQSKDGEPITAEALAASIKTEQGVVLEGQDRKIERMEQFASQMSSWAQEYVAEFRAENPNLTEAEYKAKLAEAQSLIVDAARTITYQDTKASGVTLGDHGWMHLTQDIRDSIAIAEGIRGQPLSAKEKLMLGMAGAFHDVGYSVPEVNDRQMENGGKYEEWVELKDKDGNPILEQDPKTGEMIPKKRLEKYDKGHPLNSFVFVAGMENRFAGVFGKEDAQNLKQIIANHENPNRAHMAENRSDLAEAFAIADASAAFGPDKLPPIINQVPEAVRYLRALDVFNSRYDSEIVPQLKEIPQFQAQFQQLEALQQEYKKAEAETQDPNARVRADQLKAQADALAKEIRDKALTQYKDQALNSLRKEVEGMIFQDIKNHQTSEGTPDGKIQTQAEAMVNALGHFNPDSLKFILGRMSAEASPPRVETAGSEKHIVFDVASGFARQVEQDGSIENSAQAAAKLTVKLFSEQTALQIKPDDLEKAVIRAVVKNNLSSLAPEQLTKLQELGITISTISGESAESQGVSMRAGKIVVNSLGNKPISEASTPFYDRIHNEIQEGNKQLDDWLRKMNTA